MLLKWNESVINTYCDGTLFYSIDITPGELDAFHAPFFLIINLAVGGNWPGAPDATTVFPQIFQLDYIRLYQTPDMLFIDKPVEKLKEQSLLVYPNPFKNSLSLISSKPLSQIEIQDYTGKILYMNQGKIENQSQFTVCDLAPGFYMLYVKYVDNTTELVKIVK